MIPLFRNFKEVLARSGYLSYIFLLVSVFLLAVHNEYMPPFMIAALLFWFIDFWSRGMKIKEQEKVTKLLFLVFFALNLLFLLGLFFSDNFHKGSVLYFRRLSLLIFPLILFSPVHEVRKHLPVLLKIFVFGMILYMFFCFSYALNKSLDIHNGNWIFNPYYKNEPWSNYFFGQLLSIGQHPSYIAMYSLLGMFISLDFSWKANIKTKARVLWLIMAFFMLVFIYFLSSRASFIAVLIILPIFLWIKMRDMSKKILVIFFIIFFIVLLSATYLLNQRVSIYFDKFQDPAATNDGRIEIWKSAIKVIEENPFFGKGIGDYYSAMDNAFTHSGYTFGYYKDFNAHNEYLEILCISGFTGFIIFLLILGLMFYIAVKQKNLLYGVFIMIMLIFFSGESILSRFAGNSFFALFSFLLIYIQGSSKKSVDNLESMNPD